MYRPGSMTTRQTRMQGVGNQPPADIYERVMRIDKLIADAIHDEEEAIGKYTAILDALKSHERYPEVERTQEQTHKALLERIIKRR